MKFKDLNVDKWGAWFMGQRFPVAIGRAGIGTKIGEGDNITPRGRFKIENWLYRSDRLTLPFEPLSPHSGWSDDANFEDYNQMIMRPYAGSHERLYRPDHLYDLIGVLDYNRTPIEKSKGSAIFIHAWRRPRYPTEGCIAFAPFVLQFIATNWQENSRVVIR